MTFSSAHNGLFVCAGCLPFHSRAARVIVLPRAIRDCAPHVELHDIVLCAQFAAVITACGRDDDEEGDGKSEAKGTPVSVGPVAGFAPSAVRSVMCLRCE
jgi:hypothetical protein